MTTAASPGASPTGDSMGDFLSEAAARGFIFQCTGQDESRQMLTDAMIAANMAGIRRCFAPFLRFGEATSDAMMANNADWLDKLSYIGLLRDVGTHFTINRMMTFESVKLRLDREQPMTFLEFNYMILQSYAFRELSRRHGCRLQIGGSAPD